jgi:DNA ligase-1
VGELRPPRAGRIVRSNSVHLSLDEPFMTRRRTAPRQVWEVMAADLSISPNYTAAAGLVDPTKGVSLRFPRYLRTRTDKKVSLAPYSRATQAACCAKDLTRPAPPLQPEEATNAEQVADMYKNQAVVRNMEKAAGGGGTRGP